MSENRAFSDFLYENGKIAILTRDTVSSPQFNNLPNQDIQAEIMLQFNKHSNALSILFTKLCLIVNNNL